MANRFLLTLFLLFLPIIVFSQKTATIEADFTGSDINIDGVLNEDPWMLSPAASEFIQYEPVEGSPSTRKTEVRVLFGKDDLYVGAHMYDNPEDIEKNLGRRDQYNRADWFMVSIDSYFNRRTAYTFAVNAAGVQLDGQQDDNKKLSTRDMDPTLPVGLDASWDAIWFTSVRITDEGWIAEIRIPYSMLRYSKEDLQTWGIHFIRRSPRLGEISEWPYIPRSERSNLVSGYGQVTGIRGIAPRRNIQIKPYVLSGLDLFESADEPGNVDYNLKVDIGGDIKVGLGPNVMLDATISPDFGQVEADPAVLNLTAFETFFTEKRPFFLEGADIFKFGIGNSRLFYSRRFGANEPIIAAAKLSGHSAGGLSFGIMGTTAGKNFNPAHNYGVLRAIQTIGQNSSAGGILAYYNSPVKDGIERQSITGGIDWDLRFNNNRYSFEGISAFSDRKYPAAGQEDEKGFMSGLVLRKREGIIDGHFTLLVFSDKYNPNDIGWISFEQNWYQIWSNLTYKIKSGKSFGRFQRGDVSLHYTRRYSYLEWYDMGSTINLNTNLTTLNFRFIRFGSRFNDLLGGYDLWETRGLGIWGKPRSVELTGEFNTDERRNWKISPKGSFKRYNDKGSEYSFDLQSIVNTGTRLSFQAGLKGSWEDSKTAWASNESFMLENATWKIGSSSASPGDLTYDDFAAFDDKGSLSSILADVAEYAPGQYYVPVFGKRDTRSLDLTLRGSLTFTSKFSIQLYTQFFVARGRYNRFSILSDPDMMAEFASYPKKRDFNYKNLQSNFVTRWEYRPGSAIYLVWSHGRNKRDEMNPLAPWGRSPYEQPVYKQFGDIFN
ncbi:MAG TPA: hypothetical protein DD745_01550, partial [Bacteroidales bacterium]|nr:hypothetical protein [Bacteroidales bacterium]